METPAVTITGEVNPFRVTKFITHKVEIAFSAASQCEETNHLMQGNGPINDRVVTILIHIRVHSGICQTENHGFGTNQCLVMAFNICNRTLTGAAHTHIAPHFIDIPEFVLGLCCFYPHIRKAHGQPVIKADTSIFNGKAHARHTGHILCNGNGLGIDVSDQLVGQLKVGDGFGVGIHGEILIVGVEISAQAVIVIQHGGYTVKPETIEVEFFQPELQVREQKMENTGSAIVEALCTPGRVFTLAAFMEELPYGSIEHIDTLSSVLYRMRMNQIQQHTDTHVMGFVNQILQILGLAEPGTGCVEICDLVAEASIVGMLHNGHQLDGIVTGFFYMGQDNVCKLTVSTDASFFLRHTDMRFVNVELIFTDKTIVSPGEQNLVVNNLRVESIVGFVLHCPSCIERKMLCANAIVLNNGFYLAAMPECFITGKIDFPVFIVDPGQRMGGLVPCIKFAFQI